MLLVVAGACHDLTTAPPLTPVVPDTTIVRQLGQRYLDLESAQMLEWENTLALPVALYTQQIAGIAAQPATWDLYGFEAGDADLPFQSVYASALDARQIQVLGSRIHDSLWVGIGKVWEAALIGDAASIWGDIPYRQAFDRADFPKPVFDPQLTVYQLVDVQLDSAIRFYLAAKPGLASGPHSAEMIYEGQPPDSLASIYTEVAHTLRARYYLHQAGRDPAFYARALFEAQLGISDPTHDWNWYNSQAPTANNAAYQFVTGHSAGQFAPSATLINLMHQRIASGLDANQDRLDFYFVSTANASLSCDTTCKGFRPGGDTGEPGGGGTSDFNLLNYGAGFRQPYITWTETQLIAAEAALMSGNGGVAERALTAVRSHEVYGADVGGDILASGATACSGACAFASQPPVPATLRNIIEEKYIDLFLSAEVWSDFRRTCLPYIAAAPATPTAAGPRPGAIPVRFPYGSSIVASDPNAPNVSPLTRNADSPRGCPAYSFTSAPPAY